jgi:hypothetical protein
MCTLGRHLDAAERHDPRSRAFPAAVAPLESVTHIHHGPVLDQGAIGSCTGNATAQALNCDPLMPADRRVLTEADALAIYSAGTRIDKYPGTYLPTDTGCDGLSVAKAAVKLGVATAYDHAFGLAHTLGALVLRPVMIGIPWTQGMFHLDDDGYLEPLGPVVGGHEVCLTAIDTAAENVTVLNSWSSSWGTNGTAKMRWAILGQLLGQGGDATILHTRVGPG